MMNFEPVFIAVSLGSWGKGDTLTDAFKNLKKAGGTQTKCIVYCYPADTDPYVDGNGSIMFSHLNDKYGRDPGKEIYRKGIKS